MDEHLIEIERGEHEHSQLLEDVALVVALHGDSPTILKILELLPPESLQRFKKEAYSNPYYQQTGNDARSEWTGRCRVFDSEARNLTLNVYGQSLVKRALERAQADPDLRERLTHILDAIRAEQASKISSESTYRN
jgi:hypothetical protein